MSLQSDIAQTANLIEQVVNQAVVRPTGSTGISGFLFDVVANEDVSLDSEITDHYVEDNTAIQDHIALRPERFTVKGYAGEINDQYQGALKLTQQILDKVAVLATLAPQFATQAEQIYDLIRTGSGSIGEIVNSASSVYDIFKQAITTATRQQAAFNFFYAMWRARQLCTVETPWNIFTDMAIEAVRGHQNEETKLISEFSVTFKKVRKAQTAVSVGISIAGRVAQMAIPAYNYGISTGANVDSSGVQSMLANKDGIAIDLGKTWGTYVTGKRGGHT